MDLLALRASSAPARCPDDSAQCRVNLLEARGFIVAHPVVCKGEDARELAPDVPARVPKRKASELALVVPAPVPKRKRYKYTDADGVQHRTKKRGECLDRDVICANARAAALRKEIKWLKSSIGTIVADSLNACARKAGIGSRAKVCLRKNASSTSRIEALHKFTLCFGHRNKKQKERLAIQDFIAIGMGKASGVDVHQRTVTRCVQSCAYITMMIQWVVITSLIARLLACRPDWSISLILYDEASHEQQFTIFGLKVRQTVKTLVVKFFFAWGYGDDVPQTFTAVCPPLLVCSTGATSMLNQLRSHPFSRKVVELMDTLLSNTLALPMRNPCSDRGGGNNKMETFIENTG